MSDDSFKERNKGHGMHLDDVIQALGARNWETELVGQEFQTPPDLLGVMGRWMPDVLATRGPYGAMYVDAKDDNSPTTKNYSIELAALACYGMVRARFGREVVLVWPGGTCNYASDLRPTRVETRAPERGSGTAFVLVKEDDQRSMDDVFGPVDRKAA